MLSWEEEEGGGLFCLFFSRLMRWEEEGGQDVSVTSSSHFVCFVSLSGSPLFGKRKAGETINKTVITAKMLLISFHDKLFLAVPVPPADILPRTAETLSWPR